MRTILLASALCIGLTACASEGGRPSAEGPEEALMISPKVWGWYQEYARTPQPLAFAVSADGHYAGSYYCEDHDCPIGDARSQALAQCGKAGGGSCRIFAVGTDIKVRYELLP